ncbi:hypothetical protein D3C71_1959280 [compost metagenome]
MKKQRLNSTALMRWRSHWPNTIPSRAGASTSNEAPSSPPASSPRQNNMAANARVEAVKDNPRACTSSSRLKPRACR